MCDNTVLKNFRFGLLVVLASILTTHVEAQLFLTSKLKPYLDVRRDTSLDILPASHDSIFSANVTGKTKKYFWRGAGTLMLTEAIPLVYDRYVANKDYARISFKTIGDHFKFSAWQWDDDGFTENQFGHPYHGNLFFNTFRNNGYGYWESVPAAFLGSYMWETIAENQNPAPNDLINTTMGGMTLGEMTYRIAHKILNPHKRGLQRTSREIFATLINPVMGFTRATNGKWGKVSDDPNYEDPASLFATVDVGLRRFNNKTSDVFGKGKNAVFGRVSLLYVDSTASLTTPFREFFVRAELGNDDSAKINNISVYGSLSAWDIGGTENSIQRVVLTVNYDLYHNSAFYYGAQGFNAVWQTHYYLLKSDITGMVGVGPVILAAIPNQYLHFGANRRYDYASGGGAVANLSYGYNKRFFADFVYRGSVVKTISGLNGSHYFLNNYSVSAGYRFWENISVNLEYSGLTLKNYYRDYPDDTKRYPMGRIYVRYLIF